jgi:hypothetical protein
MIVCAATSRKSASRQSITHPGAPFSCFTSVGNGKNRKDYAAKLHDAKHKTPFFLFSQNKVTRLARWTTTRHL